MKTLEKQLVMKCGHFYFMSYDEETEEGLYSSSIYSAMKFPTIDDLSEAAERFNIEGYTYSVA